MPDADISKKEKKERFSEKESMLEMRLFDFSQTISLIPSC
jgi:hypothetical protein